MGYSVGRWDADTLVVDTVGLNDLAWLDAFDHPRTEASIRLRDNAGHFAKPFHDSARLNGDFGNALHQ